MHLCSFFTGGEDEKEARWGEESDWLAGLTSGLLARGLETRDLGSENPPSLLAILYKISWVTRHKCVPKRILTQWPLVPALYVL